MEQRADLDGRQVKCLIASEGHLWMRVTLTGFRSRATPACRKRFQHLPGVHGRRCSQAARQRKETKPSVATYFRVIEAIERKLKP